MNIFVLGITPKESAVAQCDKHVVKMPLETAQMLCTAINKLGGSAVYKSTHVNHPCSVWARETLGNFLWLYEHGIWLCLEYSKRYGKTHKSQAVIEQCLRDLHSVPLHNINRTNHPLCMPDEYKTTNVIESYRSFYIGEKSEFAQWNKSTQSPSWWLEEGAYPNG